MPTIQEAVASYVEIVTMARSPHTARAYSHALDIFQRVLKRHELDAETSPIASLTEEAFAWLLVALKDYSPSTERIYSQAARGFYKYLESERLADINLPRLQMFLEQRARRPGYRLPQFPLDDIERVLKFFSDPSSTISTDYLVYLRALRDRAFLLTLADTGLRVHEACQLRRGDIDWNEGQALIIGKGNKQAVVRFTSRSMKALRDYLAKRADLDGSSGKPLASLPLFARHDKGAGKKIKPITTATGRNLVKERVSQALGEDAHGRITPHSFRHYFVTAVLRGTGNLRYAQELARHENMAVTQRYTHLSDDELDKAYHDVFEKNSEPRTK